MALQKGPAKKAAKTGSSAKSKSRSGTRPSAKAPAAKVSVRAPVAKVVAAKTGNEVSIMARQLAADLEKRLAAGQEDLMSEPALQALMAALCKTYAVQIQGDNFMPLASVMSVTPTDVMLMTGALLKAANLQVFELGMWQSWTGR